MAGAPDAEQHEVDSAGLFDLVLVLHAVALHGVRRNVAAGNVDLVRRNVDVVEEVLVHEPVVALQAARVHRVVLVEVKRYHVREVEPVIPAHADELLVHADGGGPGRQAKNCLLVDGLPFLN
ncbi:hypothetical protein GGP93_000372 [Salinibacter ruber]|nr:hypothetical protein [Salinibacter ruber]